MRLAVLVLLLASAVADDTCRKVDKDEATRLGHEVVIVDKRDEPVREVSGTVRDQIDYPIADALVEIYELPDPVPSLYPSGVSGRNRKRVRGCLTGEGGHFSFKPKNGTYELRVSNPNFNTISMWMVVDRRKGKAEPLKVTLPVGT